MAERLKAENSILRRENTELKQLFNKRKERMSGKRLILKGKVIVSTEEVHRKLAEAEMATKGKKNKQGKSTARRVPTRTEMYDEDVDNDSEAEEPQIGDCIVVQFN